MNPVYQWVDLLDRLNQTTGSWGVISFGYDAVGNRVSKSVEGGSTVTYSYDSLDRLVSATGLGFDWDGNGNLLYMSDGLYEWNYSYDSLNRLTGVQRDGVLSSLHLMFMMLVGEEYVHGTRLMELLIMFTVV